MKYWCQACRRVPKQRCPYTPNATPLMHPWTWSKVRHWPSSLDRALGYFYKVTCRAGARLLISQVYLHLLQGGMVPSISNRGHVAFLCQLFTSQCLSNVVHDQELHLLMIGGDRWRRRLLMCSRLVSPLWHYNQMIHQPQKMQRCN